MKMPDLDLQAVHTDRSDLNSEARASEPPTEIWVEEYAASGAVKDGDLDM